MPLQKVRQRKPFILRKSVCQKGDPAEEIIASLRQAASGNESSNPGDSIMTVELDQSENDAIMTVQEPDTYQLCLFATMKIKTGKISKFKNRYWSHLQRIRKSEKRIKSTAHVLKGTGELKN